MKIKGMGGAALAPPRSEVADLKRGALKNTVALLASNFRGVFTFLVARLLGSAALGILSVSWAVTDLLTKIGMFALDNTITISRDAAGTILVNDGQWPIVGATSTGRQVEHS
jgi:hypothetical protein